MKYFGNSHLFAVVISTLLVCSSAPMASADEIALYFSTEGNDSWAGSIDRPFATIQRARDAIRAMNRKTMMTKPFMVYIRGGLYELAEPVVLTLEDSGTRACPITYTAYKDEEPVISGGRKITGPWKDYKGKIKVCSIPEGREGKWMFRQLFLNGERQQRARFPNEDSYVMGENVLEGLDQPGEWYLDRHTGELYYWPVEGGKLSELRAPVTNELVRFEGDVERKNHVEYINIRGLTFCDADYILPKEGIPTIIDIGDIWFPSAITLKGVSNCVFEDNTVRNVGTYGVDLTGDGNHIIGNKIYDTGSGGIITRSYGKHRNIVSYNHIHHCGSVFHSAVGINIDDGGGLIGNNLIHNISHSGIYTRHYATDYGQGGERSNMEQGLIIEYNEIYDVMQGMSDGAGIFVRDDNIVIRNNLIHDVRSAPEGLGGPGWGITLGCNTRNCLVENNIVYNTRDGIQVWYNNQNNTIFNNIFLDGVRAQISYSNNIDAYHHNVRLLRNIISFSDPDAVLYRFRQSSGRSLPTESDYNLIYHAAGKDLAIGGLPKEGDNYSINIGMAAETFADWQNLGFDTHSIVADPLFVDPENDDYSLKPESPAWNLGFKPIDLSQVGLRGLKQR